VTFSAGRRAIARLSQFAVRPDAGLSVDTPKQTFIGTRHGRIGLGKNKLRFPAQSWTKIRMIGVEAVGFLKR
jgi:hypothetical protein